MPDLLLKIILPCIGILIILFCIGAYFFRYGAHIKDNVQEFKVFGADMKISIVTVFVLIGLVFIFAGTYSNVVDTNSKLTKMLEDERLVSRKYETENIDLQSQVRTLKLSQNKTLSYYLDLSSVKNLPNPSKLKIYYTVWGSEDRQIPLKCTPVTQNNQERLQVTISDIAPGTFIASMTVVDLQTNRKWQVKGFWPLSPSLKLESTT